MNTEQFLLDLSSSDPVPGGGGVSALVATLSSALCSMVGNLTSGKKKYAEYQADIERIIAQACIRRESLYAFIEKDAEAFEPLSKAYSIPKDDPKRDEILEKALKDAAQTPLNLMKEIVFLVPMLEELSVKGSKLAVSDVAVAATLARAAIEGAVMNVYINTKMMKDRAVADEMNKEADEMLDDTVIRCQKVYHSVMLELKA